MTTDNQTMYLLIRIGQNHSLYNEMASAKKRNLETHIKQMGFYWSKKLNRYINDKTSGVRGGNGKDYLIHKIEVI